MSLNNLNTFSLGRVVVPGVTTMVHIFLSYSLGSCDVLIRFMTAVTGASLLDDIVSYIRL